MAAEEHLSGQQFYHGTLYHRASPKDRESIQRSGLRPSNPLGAGANDPNYPTGVFLGNKDVAMDGRDLWEVNATGLTTHPDPISGNRGHRYSPTVIAPANLRLIKNG